jgi:hypothetical protein
MPRLPFKKVGLLIVDEIGKNISGAGMDTNVVGRKFSDHAATERDEVACKRIFVRGLTHETHGNGCGIGIAEFSTQRAVDQIDMNITRINALTGGHPAAAAIPCIYPTDRDAIEAALETVGLDDPANSRVVHIPNTLHLREVLVSEAYLTEVKDRPDLEILEGPTEMDFDGEGFLAPVLSGAAAAH